MLWNQRQCPCHAWLGARCMLIAQWMWRVSNRIITIYKNGNVWRLPHHSLSSAHMCEALQQHPRASVNSVYTFNVYLWHHTQETVHSWTQSVSVNEEGKRTQVAHHTHFFQVRQAPDKAMALAVRKWEEEVISGKSEQRLSLWQSRSASLWCSTEGAPLVEAGR